MYFHLSATLTTLLRQQRLAKGQSYMMNTRNQTRTRTHTHSQNKLQYSNSLHYSHIYRYRYSYSYSKRYIYSYMASQRIRSRRRTANAGRAGTGHSSCPCQAGGREWSRGGPSGSCEPDGMLWKPKRGQSRSDFPRSSSSSS